MDLTYKVGIDESELVQKLSQTKLMIEQTLQSATSSYAGGIKAGFMSPFEETMGSLGAQANLQATTRLSNVQNMTLGVAQLGAMAGEYTSLPFYQNLMFGTRPSSLGAELQVGSMYSRLQQGPANFMNVESTQNMMRMATDPFQGQVGFQRDFTQMLSAMGQSGFTQNMRTPQDLYRGVISAGESVRTAQGFGIPAGTAGQMFSQMAQAGVNPADLSRAFEAAISAGNAGVSDAQSMGAAAMARSQRNAFQAYGVQLPGLQGSQAIDVLRQVQNGAQAVADRFERGTGQRFEFDTMQSNAVAGIVMQQMTYSGKSQATNEQILEAMRMMAPAQMARLNKDDLISDMQGANADNTYNMMRAKNTAGQMAQLSHLFSLQGVAGLAMGELSNIIPGALGDFLKGVAQPAYETPRDQGMIRLNKAGALPYLQRAFSDTEGARAGRSAATQSTSVATLRGVFGAAAAGDFGLATQRIAESDNPQLRDALSRTFDQAQDKFNALSADQQAAYKKDGPGWWEKTARALGGKTAGDFVGGLGKEIGKGGNLIGAVLSSAKANMPDIMDASGLTAEGIAGGKITKKAVDRARSAMLSDIRAADPGFSTGGKHDDVADSALIQRVYQIAANPAMVKDKEAHEAALSQIGDPRAFGVYNALAPQIMADGKVGYGPAGRSISRDISQYQGLMLGVEAQKISFEELSQRMLIRGRGTANEKYIQDTIDQVHRDSISPDKSVKKSAESHGMQALLSGSNPAQSDAVRILNSDRQIAGVNRKDLNLVFQGAITSLHELANAIKNFGTTHQ